MIRDLRTILEGWEFEPGQISVRKIIGRDGHEKIQTRIDLGVLQLECAGRPDGQRPHGHDSLLDYHEQRLRDHIELYGNDEDFILSPEDCRELRHEAHLFYQRYLALFILEEFENVEGDAVRSLRLIDLCARYAATQGDRAALSHQRPYVVMMHTRARAQQALQAGQVAAALAMVDEGLQTLAGIGDDVDEDAVAVERNVLSALRQEVLDHLPPEAPVRLESELALALEFEDYERAALLRDRLLQCGGGDPTTSGD